MFKIKNILWIICASLTLTICATQGFAQQDTLRIATYNLLKFPGSNGNGRLADFRRVVHHIQPDILVVQELQSDAGLQLFLKNVMNAKGNVYSAAPFIDGRDTDNGLLYKTNKIQLIGLNPIQTNLRDITQYVLVANSQEVSIFSAHLKASSSSSDKLSRLVQATTLRDFTNTFFPNSQFMLVGDFNMRSSAETAFIKLTGDEADNDGRFFDPLNQPGAWNNAASFAPIHTQSTRTTSFNGGATGGLDDRFDFILVSETLMQPSGIQILPATHTALGNDSNHFNQAINQGQNSAVPDSIADALHQASDHLPVYADFLFGSPISAISESEIETPPSNFYLAQNYPNPFNPTTTIRYVTHGHGRVTLKVYNIKGSVVANLVDAFQAAGNHEVKFDGGKLAGGVYFYRLQAGGQTLSRKLLLIK